MYGEIERLKLKLPQLMGKYVSVVYGPRASTYLMGQQIEFQFSQNFYLGLKDTDDYQGPDHYYYFSGHMFELSSGEDIFFFQVADHTDNEKLKETNVLYPKYQHGDTVRPFRIEGIRLLGYVHEAIDRVSPMAIYFQCSDDQIFMAWIQFPMEGLHLCFDRSVIEAYLDSDPAYGADLSLISEWKAVT